MRQILTGTLQLFLLVKIPMEEPIVGHKVVYQRTAMGEYVKPSFGDLQRGTIDAHWMVARSCLLTEMGKELLDVCMCLCSVAEGPYLGTCFFTLLDRDKG
jgi:hypothetical protein